MGRVSGKLAVAKANPPPNALVFPSSVVPKPREKLFRGSPETA
jgi:hypothetical protein